MFWVKNENFFLLTHNLSSLSTSIKEKSCHSLDTTSFLAAVHKKERTLHSRIMLAPDTTLVSYSPYFRVADWDLATPIMQEMLDRTSATPGWDNFGWSRAGDRLLLRNAFNDVDTMLSSFETVSPFIDRMVAGPATLDRFNFSAPLDEMARIQAQTARDLARFNTKPVLLEQDMENQSGYVRKPTSGVSETFCTMTPNYTIKDWSAARPIMQQIIDQANADPGCTYFGWEKSGDILTSRENFTDGEAMKTHLENVKPYMEKLKAGPAQMDELEVHGPVKELEKVKDVAAPLNPVYYESSTKQIKNK
jgi:quinol monooxygenase YgiN